MDEKAFSLVAGVIFAVVALFHLVRIFMEWTIVIGNWSVPMWVSWIALVVAGAIALRGCRLSERKREGPFQFGGDPPVPIKVATTPKAPVTAAAAKATANNSSSRAHARPPQKAANREIKTNSTARRPSILLSALLSVILTSGR